MENNFLRRTHLSSSICLFVSYFGNPFLSCSFFPSQFCFSKMYAVANIAPYRMMNCLKMISDGSVRLEWAKKFYKWKITMHWLIERVYWSLSCKLTTFNYWNNSHTDSIDSFLLKIMHIFLERIEFTVSSHMWVYLCVCVRMVLFGILILCAVSSSMMVASFERVRTELCEYIWMFVHLNWILLFYDFYGHLVGVAILGETCMNR